MEVTAELPEADRDSDGGSAVSAEESDPDDLEYVPDSDSSLLTSDASGDSLVLELDDMYGEDPADSEYED